MVVADVGAGTGFLAAGLAPTLVGSGEIPEIIVVGIAYKRISTFGEFGKLRERDMLPPGFVHAPPDSRTPQFITFLQQDDILLCAIFFFFCCSKYPSSGASGFKVFFLNPSVSFIWMPSYRPLP